VFVIKRFHKILDVLDKAVLSDLREAERSGLIRTVVITPYPHAELKDRWRRRGHVFTVSDYGDSHSQWTPRPLEAEEATAFGDACEVERCIAEEAWELSGGIPEPLADAVGYAMRRRMTELSRENRRSLRAVVEASLRRFVRWLDAPPDRGVRQAVVDLSYGINAGRATIILSRHPWSGVLLEDSE